MPLQNLRIIGIVVLITVVLVVPLVLVGGTGQTPTNESVGSVYSTGGPKCVDAFNTTDVGWIHEVSMGDGYSITSAVIVTHSGSELDATVRNQTDGQYTIQIDANGSTGPRNTTCKSATEIVFATKVPSDFESVTLQVNNHEVKTIPNDDSMPDLYEIPPVINTSTENG
ncbi:hypothetical protein [Halorientalis persicus]|uniref:hypothetical protein n=1 Tax=Halorientalis persicus TaxID=1367881 RepID=UPI0011143B70|nr:hypothetical protein [Halorientalis persicus]